MEQGEQGLNYYDYRSYFQEITGDLDRVYSRQGDQLTELQELRTEVGEKLDGISQQIAVYGIMISALILITVVFGVLK